MSIFTKLDLDKTYQLHFSSQGLCFDVFKRYKILFYAGECVDWCDEDDILKYNKVEGSLKDTQVILGLNCWDILKFLESEDNEVCNLIESSYNAEEIKRIQREQAIDYIQDDS